MANSTRVLLYDLETSPNIAYIWGKYEQNAVGDFIKERRIICFAWKWLGEKRTHVFSLRKQKVYDKDDVDKNKELVKKLWELFDEADIVIAHNGDRFDQKRSRTEFIRHRLLPPSPPKEVDTRKIAKSVFDFNSNKLDDLGEFLKLGRKVDTGGFKLWLGCLAGNAKAWAKMEKYNKRDVVLLEKVYLRLRAWAKTHPSMVALDDRVGCPTCGGTRLHRRGSTISGAGTRPRYQCQGCGKWSRGKPGKLI